MTTTLESPRTEERINFRLEAQQKRLIEEAARLTGQSVTAFALSTLMRSAQELVERFGRTTLSDRDRDLFLALLDADDEPEPALLAAVADYKTRIE